AEKLLPGFAREALSLMPQDAIEAKLPQYSPAGGSGSPRGEVGKTGGDDMAYPQPNTGGREENRGCVGFVSGCVMSVLFGETNANSVRLLNRAGFDVVTPPAQGCCGALYAHGHRSLRAARSGRHHHQRRRLRLHAQGVWAVASRRPGVGGARKKVQRQGQGPHRGPCRR
ncbi:MAG: hypothetical protein DME18_17670, partial [Verrucomicrobia bacterium]